MTLRLAYAFKVVELDFVVDIANPDIAVICHRAIIPYSNIIARPQSGTIFDPMEGAAELRTRNPQRRRNAPRRIAGPTPYDARHGVPQKTENPPRLLPGGR
jgi:hypothetical protein